MRILGIVVPALLLVASAAHAVDCKGITDPVARLACFDAAPKAAAKKTPQDEDSDDMDDDSSRNQDQSN